MGEEDAQHGGTHDLGVLHAAVHTAVFQLFISIGVPLSYHLSHDAFVGFVYRA